MIYFQKAVLPARVKSLTLTMTDGGYTVLVNADLNPEQAAEAAKHEVEHIVGLDFEKHDVSLIEMAAHEGGRHEEEIDFILSRLLSDGRAG